MFCLTLFHFTFLCSILQWNWKMPIEKSLKYFSILQPMKKYFRFEYVPWKISDFVSFSLLGFTLAIKLRKFGFESHWNTDIFDKKKTSDLNMPHGKMSDFISVPLFGFTLVIKLRKFSFESHWNTVFWLKIWRQIWICPMEKYLILFLIQCLGWL